MTERWTGEAARNWYAGLPWLVGANYVPSTAVNELEMFQAATFDEARNDRELGFAAAFGLNCVRVFLHPLLWQEAGFLERLDRFFTLAARHGLHVMPVLFDSCWDPRPHPGAQPDPIPGVHNSRWVQSPGAVWLASPAHEPLLQAYVREVVGAFRDDKRILAWDIWNEPDNGWGVYEQFEPEDKLARVERLLPLAFAWAREAGPSQPLTSAPWAGDVLNPTPVQRTQLELSDVLSFHNYEGPESFAARIEQLRPLRRPILCTEYLARPHGSTFSAILPVARAANVGVMHWGLVTGRTQTRLPWDSWTQPYVNGREPAEWYHDILHADGTAYREGERRLVLDLVAQPKSLT